MDAGDSQPIGASSRRSTESGSTTASASASGAISALRQSMATIIDFKVVSRPAHLAVPQSALPGPAQLLLFTGVRYERRDEPAPAPHSRRRGGRKTAQINAQD